MFKISGVGDAVGMLFLRNCLKLVQVLVLVLDHFGPTLLWFVLGTFFRPDSVHV